MAGSDTPVTLPDGSEDESDRVGEILIPTLVARVLGLADEARDDAKAWLDRMLEASGNTKDPLERMIIEPACLAFIMATRLMARMGSSDAPAREVREYSNAGILLFEEMSAISPW